MNRKKALGNIIFSYHLLQKSCDYLVTDNVFYQNKVKYLLNNLIKLINPVLKTFETFVLEEDKESINDQLQTRIECIEMLQEVFEQNPLKIYEAHLFLKNILEGKRVFTENELKLLQNEIK